MQPMRSMCTMMLAAGMSVCLAGCAGSGNFNLGYALSGSTLGSGGSAGGGTGGSGGGTGSGGGGTGGGGGGGGGVPVVPAVSQIYVIQDPVTTGTGSGMILQFAATSSGSVAPTQTIVAPPNTSFDGLATDKAGNVYVSATSAVGSDVRVYAAGASGAATPVRVLPADSTTRLGTVAALAASADGEIFVAKDNGAVAAFSATAQGSVAPERYVPGASEVTAGLSTLTTANGITADPVGNLYILNNSGPLNTAVVIFGPTATGNVAPLRTISGSQTTTLAYAVGETTDSLGNLYVTNNNFSVGDILVFAPGASGGVAPERIIAGDKTQITFVYGIKVDAAGNIFVVSSDSAGLHPTVLKFAANATGNVAPISSFTSSAWTTTDRGANLAIF